MNANDFRDQLITMLAADRDILGIGQTGDIFAPLIPGKSDIDLFVICERIPDRQERLSRYQPLIAACSSLQMEVCSGGVWGYGDIFVCEGIDVMPMYFTKTEMEGYLREVLDGRHLEREGRFYPIGRLASIEALHVLHEKDASWTKIISMVKAHPPELFSRWYSSEIGQMIDEEDLGRAELRHEVLFYHQVTEAFLDHFLQALYAKNNCYFPSRKRAEEAIASFKLKPAACFERLLRIVELGSRAAAIDQSVAELRKLAEELKELS